MTILNVPPSGRLQHHEPAKHAPQCRALSAAGMLMLIPPKLALKTMLSVLQLPLEMLVHHAEQLPRLAACSVRARQSGASQIEPHGPVLLGVNCRMVQCTCLLQCLRRCG